MKKQLTTLLLLITALNLLSQPVVDWTRTISGSNVITDVTTDLHGNTYTVGMFTGTLDFDSGGKVSNLTSKGNSPDIFVQKLDTYGQLIWAVGMGGNDVEDSRSIAIDQLGNVYTTGYFSSDTSDFDPGPEVYNLHAGFPGMFDLYVQKLDANGNFLWAHSLGKSSAENSTNSGQASRVEIDKMNNVIIIGPYNGTIDMDPSPEQSMLHGTGVFLQKLNEFGKLIFAKKLDKNVQDITLNANGDMFVSGDDSTYMYVQKLNSYGETIWIKAITGGSNDNKVSSIATDKSGNIYLSGYAYDNNSDFNPGEGVLKLQAGPYVQKLDSSGNLLWAVSFPGENSFAYLTADSNQNVYITGFFTGIFDADPREGVYNLNATWNGSTPSPEYTNNEIFLVKLNKEGNFIWATQMGNLWDDEGFSLALDKKGHIYVTGYSNFDLSRNTKGFVTRFSEKGSITGLEKENNTSKIISYPNPTSGSTTIELEKRWASASLEVRDIYGKVVSVRKDFNVSSLNLFIEGPSGLYSVMVKTPETTTLIKIVKE